jgi:hypothetical protein
MKERSGDRKNAGKMPFVPQDRPALPRVLPRLW